MAWKSEVLNFVWERKAVVRMEEKRNQGGESSVSIRIPAGAMEVLKTLNGAGYEAYVVGGCVRDSILGREPQDWDVTTSARPEEVKALFRRTIDTGIQHGTVTVMVGKEGYEVTTYRIDGKYEDNRHPSEVIFTPSLEEDLKRRDFTPWHTMNGTDLWMPSEASRTWQKNGSAAWEIRRPDLGKMPFA